MKRLIIITGLIISLVLLGITGCTGGEAQDAEKTTEVTRGDLAITVSGSGNIEVSEDVDLTFGVAGRIEQIPVEEGDSVSQGDVIAALETDALKLALNQALVAEAQAKIAVTNAEITVLQYEAAVTTAEATLKNAEIALEQTTNKSTYTDIKIAKAAMDSAKRDLDEALVVLSKYDEGTPGYDGFQERVVQSQARYQTAKDVYDAMLLGFGTEEVLSKQKSVDAATQSLEVARQSYEVAKLGPDLAVKSLELATQSRENAQNQLDKAAIIAPFDGKVASIYVEEGGTVLTTVTIAHLVNPSRMELEVQVDEIDVPEMEVGQKAIIDIDALPDIPLEGKITFISVLPTTEAGVVVYDVKIEFEAPEGVGLRPGMSASTDIIIKESNNVLLVPARAVKRDDGNTYVEVMVGEQYESRNVVIGITDGFHTEIKSGLEEDEKVKER